MRHGRPLLAAFCAALLVPASSTAAADPSTYVALGDSYTAAPLVPNLVGTPAGCLRSDHNYPSLVAAALRPDTVRDVSCTAAQTKDMTAPQDVRVGANPPQFDALRGDETLVTVGIGGNDVGLVGAAVTCVSLGLLAPTGTACRANYAAPEGDRLTARIAATAPRIATVLREIHARAPGARVLLVGYPDVLPRSGGGCYPMVPLSPDDVRYFDGLIVQTNAMLAEQAAANAAEYVDTYIDSVGHDVCTLPPTRWFEGLAPTSAAFPLHPNALGMRSMARSVLRVLARRRPAPVVSDLGRTRRRYARGRAARLSYRLDTSALVTIGLRRRTSGRRSGSACRRPSASNRGGRRCRYYAVVKRSSATGRAGTNALKVRVADYRRRAGLYRLTVTPTANGIQGGARSIHFRIAR